MIKLNNKNITYVALADSNNSLKAPKEIWYADSSNSVKLVYRRKDALIEGEDYEKYHWLVSNSENSKTPYIDTLIPPDLNQNIAFSFKVINSTTNGGEPGVYGVLLPTSWRNCVIRCYKNISYNYIILEYNNDNADFPQRENMIIKTEFSEGKEYDCSLSINSSTTALGVINNESKELVANSNVNFVLNPQPTYKLFVQNAPTWSFNSVGFKKFNITNLISLVPCKLLKPVPKWLDANGIRRQVGECGMIDLVSGKFYGNVNSVGTFTVENYYERKEWLIGDGSAYIDTDIIVDVPTLHYNVETVLNTASTLCGSRNANRSNSSSISVTTPTRLRLDIFDATTYVDFSGGVIDVDVPNKVITINDVPFTTTRTNFGNANYSFRIFDLYYRDNYDDVPRGTMKIHHFSITDNSHNLSLIPCTLTMDLPASMDANNIARTKGTSGMWDLVSDKFYGNVANSGTFKAVNLAEGVDYEVHQWLRIDVNTLQLTQMMNLPVNSYQFSFRRKWLRQGTYYIHSSYFVVEGYYYFTNQNIKMRIWDGANATQIYSSGTRFNLGDTITINCNAENYNFDGVNMPIYGVCKFIPFDCSVDNPSVGADIAFSTSSITVDGIERYIPVKLLRSIPSKYDANGIARQAGECGMYDTINDLFYGNVASSGTFSVSDDS